jgi:hypothetical protein
MIFARGLVVVVGLHLGERVARTQQGHAAAGNDALFDGRTVAAPSCASPSAGSAGAGSGIRDQLARF